MNGVLLKWRSRRLTSNHADERLRAVEKLAAQGDRQAVPLLIDALGDSDPEVRGGVALALAELRDTRAVRPLVTLLLHEREHDVANKVAAALGSFESEQGVSLLVAALDEQEVTVRQAAAVALRKIGWSSLSDTQRARVAIIRDDWALAASFGPAAVEPLKAALVDGTLRGKRRAAETLGRVATPEALAALLSVLRRARLKRGAREIAAWALQEHFWTTASKADLALAAILLGKWSVAVDLGQAAVEALSEALLDGRTPVRAHAAETLRQIRHPKAIDALAKTLTDARQDVSVRHMAARFLGEIGDERAVEALVCALEDEAWQVRTAAASALDGIGWHPKQDTHVALYALARKSWSEVRAAGSAAVVPLVGALRYQAVSQEAARALTHIGPGGVDALLDVLRDSDREVAVREVVSIALAGIGDPRAIEPLQTMLKDPDMAVRQSVVWTLERLGWEPGTESEHAMTAIAHDDWDQLRGLGPAAAEPLLRLAADSLAPNETVAALEHLLDTMPGRLAIAHLREMAAIEDFRPPPGTQADPGLSQPVKCGTIRRRAKVELARRGILF